MMNASIPIGLAWDATDPRFSWKTGAAGLATLASPTMLSASTIAAIAAIKAGATGPPILARGCIFAYGTIFALLAGVSGAALARRASPASWTSQALHLLQLVDQLLHLLLILLNRAQRQQLLDLKQHLCMWMVCLESLSAVVGRVDKVLTQLLIRDRHSKVPALGMLV